MYPLMIQFKLSQNPDQRPVLTDQAYDDLQAIVFDLLAALFAGRWFRLRTLRICRCKPWGCLPRVISNTWICDGVADVV